jgi:hypothetical protein
MQPSHPIPPEAKRAYEREIAPAIRAIAERCRELGIPMFAMFQDAPESFRTTAVCGERAIGEKFKLLRHVHGAWDADDLIRALIDDGLRHGHQSLFLKALGVPPEAPEVKRG